MNPCSSPSSKESYASQYAQKMAIQKGDKLNKREVQIPSSALNVSIRKEKMHNHHRKSIQDAFKQFGMKLCDGTKLHAVNKAIQIIGVLPHNICSQITSLYLSQNDLKTLEGIEQFSSLRLLSVGGNLLTSFQEIERLKCLKTLRNVNLLGNPFSDQPNYRLRVINTLGQILTLDGMDITKEDKEKAKIVSAQDKARREMLVQNHIDIQKLQHTVQIICMHRDFYGIVMGGTLNGRFDQIPSMDQISFDVDTYFRICRMNHLIETPAEKNLIESQMLMIVTRTYHQLTTHPKVKAKEFLLKLSGCKQKKQQHCSHPQIQRMNVDQWEEAYAHVIALQQSTMVKLRGLCDRYAKETTEYIKTLLLVDPQTRLKLVQRHQLNISPSYQEENDKENRAHQVNHRKLPCSVSELTIAPSAKTLPPQQIDPELQSTIAELLEKNEEKKDRQQQKQEQKMQQTFVGRGGHIRNGHFSSMTLNEAVHKFQFRDYKANPSPVIASGHSMRTTQYAQAQDDKVNGISPQYDLFIVDQIIRDEQVLEEEKESEEFLSSLIQVDPTLLSPKGNKRDNVTSINSISTATTSKIPSSYTSYEVPLNENHGSRPSTKTHDISISASSIPPPSTTSTIASSRPASAFRMDSPLSTTSTISSPRIASPLRSRTTRRRQSSKATGSSFSSQKIGEQENSPPSPPSAPSAPSAPLHEKVDENRRPTPQQETMKREDKLILALMASEQRELELRNELTKMQRQVFNFTLEAKERQLIQEQKNKSVFYRAKPKILERFFQKWKQKYTKTLQIKQFHSHWLLSFQIQTIWKKWRCESLHQKNMRFFLLKKRFLCQQIHFFEWKNIFRLVLIGRKKKKKKFFFKWYHFVQLKQNYTHFQNKYFIKRVLTETFQQWKQWSLQTKQQEIKWWKGMTTISIKMYQRQLVQKYFHQLRWWCCLQRLTSASSSSSSYDIRRKSRIKIFFTTWKHFTWTQKRWFILNKRSLHGIQRYFQHRIKRLFFLKWQQFATKRQKYIKNSKKAFKHLFTRLLRKSWRQWKQKTHQKLSNLTFITFQTRILESFQERQSNVKLRHVVWTWRMSTQKKKFKRFVVKTIYQEKRKRLFSLMFSQWKQARLFKLKHFVKQQKFELDSIKKKFVLLTKENEQKKKEIFLFKEQKSSLNQLLEQKQLLNEKNHKTIVKLTEQVNLTEKQQLKEYDEKFQMFEQEKQQLTEKFTVSQQKCQKLIQELTQTKQEQTKTIHFLQQYEKQFLSTCQEWSLHEKQQEQKQNQLNLKICMLERQLKEEQAKNHQLTILLQEKNKQLVADKKIISKCTCLQFNTTKFSSINTDTTINTAEEDQNVDWTTEKIHQDLKLLQERLTQRLAEEPLEMIQLSTTTTSTTTGNRKNHNTTSITPSSTCSNTQRKQKEQKVHHHNSSSILRQTYKIDSNCSSSITGSHSSSDSSSSRNSTSSSSSNTGHEKKKMMMKNPIKQKQKVNLKAKTKEEEIDKKHKKKFVHKKQPSAVLLKKKKTTTTNRT